MSLLVCVANHHTCNLSGAGGFTLLKKSERLARAAMRKAQLEQYEREEVAMQSFLEECRVSLSPAVWTLHYSEARQQAGETLHIVQHFMWLLADKQLPISPRLRKAIDAMLEGLNIDRKESRWKDLHQLNYSPYWKAQYGYT
jgi:hypothetical protein